MKSIRKSVTGTQISICAILYFSYILSFGYLCFHNFAILLPAAALFPFYLRFYTYKKRSEKAQARRVVFGRILELITGNLQAGLAPNCAIEEALRYVPEFPSLFPLSKKNRPNDTVYDMFILRLSESGDEKFSSFAEILRISVSGGGDLIPVLHYYLEELSMEEEIERALSDELAKKKYELRIMQFVPYFMYGYVGLIYRGYFDVLYEGVYGRVMMLFACGLYFLAYFLSLSILYPSETALLFRKKGLRTKLRTERFYKRYHTKKYSKDGVLYDLFLQLPSLSVKESLTRLYACTDPALIYCYVADKARVVFGTVMTAVLLAAMAVAAGLGAKEVCMLPLCGLLLGLLFFAARDFDLRKYERDRREELSEDFVGIVEKLSLLHGAGLTVRNAFDRIAGDYEQSGRKRFAYEELLRLSRELHYGMSEEAVYTEFGHRLGTAEYRHFAMLLVQNMHQGSEEMTKILAQEAQRGLLRRMSEIRRNGLKSDTRLLLPTVLYLAVILLLLMVPAFAGFQLYE